MISFSRTCALLFTGLLSSVSLHAGQTCHPLSVNTCTLPFPSNFYTKTDATSPTGLRIDLKGTLFPQKLEDLIPNLTSTQVFKGAAGFSTAAPIMLEVTEEFDDSTLPLDGGDTVILFNAETGERTPIRTGRYQYAQDMRFIIKGTGASIIEIFPRSRFEFGQRYIAVVTRQLMTPEQYPVTTVPALADLNSTHPELAKVLPLIEQQGIAINDIVTFTEFTTADENSITQPLYDKLDIVAREAHPVRNLKTQPMDIWPFAAKVTGEVRLSDFRMAHGGVDWQASESKEYWTPFILMLPAAAKKTSAPVAIYGHGLLINKESMLATVAYTNAVKGIASIAIDQPNHGTRSERDGGFIIEILNSSELNRVAGLMAQSTLDLSSLTHAIQTSLATLNVVPEDNWWNRMFYRKGLSTPDLDTSRIHYQGTSMGGVLGSAFVATQSDLKSAFLQVTGVGLSNILTHSFLFKTAGFEEMIPDSANAGEAALLIHALQHKVDISDGINFIHHVRHPIRGRQPRKLVVQYGLEDSLVFNRSTEAIAELADLPLLLPARVQPEQLRTAQAFEDGYGLIQVPPALPLPKTLEGITSHISFLALEALIALGKWADVVVNAE